MRGLIEEYGQFIVALMIASTMIVTATFGISIPGLQEYTRNEIPENVNANNESYKTVSSAIKRSAPTLTVTDITVAEGELVDFDNYIKNGNIKAVNADGVDISGNIVVEPANDRSSSLYSRDNNSFGGNSLATGNYEFVVSVIDSTSFEYFGKTTKTSLTVIVT